MKTETLTPQFDTPQTDTTPSEITTDPTSLESADADDETVTFRDLRLAKPLQKALEEEKYETPTEIQEKSIPHLLQGRDLLGCAQTGTGKTAAFALPILNRIVRQTKKAHPHAPRVLVLSPTRELAAQISESFATYGKHVQFRQTTVYGGVGQAKQVRAIKKGVHVVVATPGRLLDLMNQGHIQLDRLEVFVLDEADRMLDMGFMPDLKRIIAHLPEERQSLFFSATVPDKASDLASSLLRDPVTISITPESTTVDLIEQRAMYVQKADKKKLLGQILQQPGVGQMLVFTRTKHGADTIGKLLSRNGVKADAIHGNKSQNARERTLKAFRDNKIQVLVATDLAARGIDIEGITHVVNYDLPHEPESYVHRIGRTGRAGASGIAITFVCPDEGYKLRAIERLIRAEIEVDTDQPFHANRVVHAPSKPKSNGPGKRTNRPRRQRRSDNRTSDNRTSDNRTSDNRTSETGRSDGPKKSEGDRKSIAAKKVGGPIKYVGAKKNGETKTGSGKTRVKKFHTKAGAGRKRSRNKQTT